MTTLTKAHHEWAKRAPDERFASLSALHAAALHDRDQGRVATVSLRDMSVRAGGDELALVGPSGTAAQFTHWSFGQLCTKAKAPPSYLRTLRPALAADCLNDGLAAIEPADAADSKLL